MEICLSRGHFKCYIETFKLGIQNTDDFLEWKSRRLCKWRLNYFKRHLLCLREGKVRFRHDWLIELDKMEQKFKRSGPFLAVQCHVLVPRPFSSSYTFYPWLAISHMNFSNITGNLSILLNVKWQSQSKPKQHKRKIKEKHQKFDDLRRVETFNY